MAWDWNWKDWDWKTIGVFATAAVAVTGYFATYLNNVLIEKKRAKIVLVNDQLEKLYGPLLALSSSTDTAWTEFQKRYRPRVKHYFDDENPPTEDEAREFRHWMTTVFMPANLRMQQVISENAHLIDGPTIRPVGEPSTAPTQGSSMPPNEEPSTPTTKSQYMPYQILDFLAHIQTYRAITAKWKPDDAGAALTRRSANVFLSYPQHFNVYVAVTFDKLKARQIALLESRFGSFMARL